MSTSSSKITFEQSKSYINKVVKYFSDTFTVTNVREINNDNEKMIIAYFKELSYPINFNLLRDEDGKYIDTKLQEISQDKEVE